MKYSRKMIIAATAVGAVGAAGIGATTMAANNSDSSNYPPIVQKISSTFGLDPAKVNDIFKQQRQENTQERQAKLKNTLDQAVKDGKLAQDQADKLMAELKTLHDQNKADGLQGVKSQLEQWAKNNGINNLDEILPRPGHHTHHIMPGSSSGSDDSAL